MDKNLNSISQNHGISVNERKSMYITGVLKIDSFDEEEFLIEKEELKTNLKAIQAEYEAEYRRDLASMRM